MQHNILKDSVISTATSIGITAQTGMLKDVMDLIIVTIISAIIVPLTRWIISICLQFLNKKGIIKEVEKIENATDVLINMLEEELKEAIKENDEELIKFLENEIRKWRK